MLSFSVKFSKSKPVVHNYSLSTDASLNAPRMTLNMVSPEYKNYDSNRIWMLLIDIVRPTEGDPSHHHQILAAYRFTFSSHSNDYEAMATIISRIKSLKGEINALVEAEGCGIPIDWKAFGRSHNPNGKNPRFMTTHPYIEHTKE